MWPQVQAGCYGPSVCVPPKLTEQHTKAQGDGVRRWSLQNRLDLEGGALVMRSVSLGEETGASILLYLLCHAVTQ